MSSRRLTQGCFYILLSLSDQPRHGLGIADEVETFSDGDVQLGPGILYGSIKRLLAEGLIQELDLSADDDPRRRIYRITADGRSALESELSLRARILTAARGKKAFVK